MSFFLGITTGPMMLELFSSFMEEYRESMEREGDLEVRLHPLGRISPFRHVTTVYTIRCSEPGSSDLTCRLTILFGETLRATKRSEIEGSVLAYTARD